MAQDRQARRKLAHASVELALGARSSLAEVFHENTKLGRLSARAYTAWITNFSRSRTMRQTMYPLVRYWETGQGSKSYTLMERLELPQTPPRTDLERTIAARRSIRAFSGAPLGLDEVARLLFFTYGKTQQDGVLRAVASSGALYPLELYVVALNVTGLDPGVYHYSVETSHLDVIRTGDYLPAIKDVIYWQGVAIDSASLAIVVTAAFRRNTVKYLDRGYRMILMEAGEAAQNLSLIATSMNVGACLVGGFNDDQLSELLDIDGVSEAPLLPVLLGRPA